MKNLILFISANMIFACYGQIDVPIDDNGKAEFVKIIEADGTKDELYLKGKDWIFKTFTSGDPVIQNEDKNAGRILCKTRSSKLLYKDIRFTKDGGYFTFDITLEFKDEKSRIIINNIVYNKGEVVGLNSGADLAEYYPHTWTQQGKTYNKNQWDNMRGETIKEINYLIDSFEEKIKEEVKDDNW